MQKRTYACGFGGNFQLFIFWRKLLQFSGSCAAGAFLGTTPSMDKSADNIACLLNVSYLNNSVLANAISDYFEDCSPRDAEEFGSISKDFPETGR